MQNPDLPAMLTYKERQERSVTVPPGLARDLWSAIKSLRDETANARLTAERVEGRMNDLLARMKAVGMSDHLPTLAEVQEAWRGE
jgi:hypothetical protein